jgi:uncharacterized short protein YbdD (DUF466 family)
METLEAMLLLGMSVGFDYLEGDGKQHGGLSPMAEEEFEGEGAEAGMD